MTPKSLADSPDALHEKVLAVRLSASGRFLVIISQPARLNAFAVNPQLNVYDMFSRVYLSRTELFAESGAPWKSAEHVATQVAISADEKFVAISYEDHQPGWRHKSISREARWAVHELPAGRHIATVSNPPETVAAGDAAVAPGTGGKLFFSSDSRYLYTTTRFTRQWELRTK